MSNNKEERQPLTSAVDGDRVNDSEAQLQNDVAAKSKKKKIIFGVIGVLVVIGIILAIVLPLTLKKKKDDDDKPGDPFQYKEFNPYSIDATTLVEKMNSVSFTMKQSAQLQSEMTVEQQRFMALKDGAQYKPVNPKSVLNARNNNWAKEVKFDINLNNNNQARILVRDSTMTDPDLEKRSVDQEVLPRPGWEKEARLTQLGWKYSKENFNFNLSDIYTGETVISTYNRKMLVSDSFSEMGFVLPSQRCFGLGQRNGQFQLSQGTYTMHARGREEGLPKDDQMGGKNGNHIHPFVLCQTQGKDFLGMFFVGTAPQVFEVVKFSDSPRIVLNYITVGGPIEIWFFVRMSAQDILSKYHSLIGKSQMPPYYALGIFQGSNSYKTQNQVQDVLNKYSTKNLAFEGMIIEEYNEKPHFTYTVSQDRFNQLPTIVDTMHTNNLHMIFGTSHALANTKENPSFVLSISDGKKCLIDSAPFMRDGEQVTGILSEVTVMYLDAFHKGFEPFLRDALPAFSKLVNGFDGLVMQHAHLPNDINGEWMPPTPPPTKDVKRNLATVINEESVGSFEPYLLNNTVDDYSTYNLPFIPDYKSNNNQNLDTMTISLNGSHGGSKHIANIFVHNGAAAKAIVRTFNVMTENADVTTKRPLLLAEASWSGSGSRSAALLTDLYRSWDNLKNVISQALSLSMYGIQPMVDACGSLGPMDEELCARWAQIAAFMPMVRNYYNETYKDPATGKRVNTPGSEPYNFQIFDYSSAYGASMSDRLKYSRYIYSQMYTSYRVGGSVVRPLFFDYPKDDNAFAHADRTYMLGDAIKVSPVLDKGLVENADYDVYFPQGIWYDLNDFDVTKKIDTSAGGAIKKLKASFAQTNIHLKAGKIIPFIKSSLKQTKLLQNAPTAFIIARDAAGKYAEGNVLVDDGISQLSFANNDYTFWKVRYAEKSINFWVQYGNMKYEPKDQKTHILDYIDIIDAEDLQNTDFACYMGIGLTPINLIPDYNPIKKVLQLRKESKNPDIKFADIGFIKFGDSTKEPNFCKTDTAFSYHGSRDDQDSTDTYWRYYLESLSPNVSPLVAEFQLMDDLGTINIEITSKADYDGGKQLLYRVPKPEYYTDEAFKAVKPTKKLEDFLKVFITPKFYYQIFTDAKDVKTLQWTQDQNHLYFSDYFIMDSGIFSTNPLNGNPLLGMGEKAGNIFYKKENGGVHSRYTFDQANPIEDGLPPGKNFYGYQPFYLYQASTLNWFGVFDISSYATDYIINTELDGGKTTQIHKITIGGTISKYFFQGKKIDDVIRTYQKLVGNPTVPPLWAFGWQQCRFGYTTLDEWFDVYENYKKNDLPLDVMWADIDYMDDYKLFTVSPAYTGFSDKVDIVKKDGRKFVPIMDAGVAVRKNQGYKTLDDGIAQGVFIMKSDGSAPLTAGVWGGNSYFPDFFNPNAITWWGNNFNSLYDDNGHKLKFDGIWLDENEATNFCNGYCIPEERPADSLKNKPFYVPGWRDLEDQALGVDGLHTSIKRREYDVHNLYSLMQSKATFDYLKSKLNDQKNARPYVLSRSNQPGIGKYAHHWLADNWSTVDYLAYSVDGVYNYNLFGMPFIGSDICGFNGDAAPDLCTRWHQLGSFYPFSRNHNQNGSASQEPYVFTDNIPGSTTKTYADVIKVALIRRYALIKYYYSNFHSIGDFGGSFFKPLFFEFQDDPQAYDEVLLRNNILLGDALKLSINTQTIDFVKNPTTDFYFPAARWCQIMPTIDPTKCWDTATDKKLQTLNSGLEDYYVHMRGGYLMPYNDPKDVRKTQDLENAATDIIVFANAANSAMTLPSMTTPVQASALGYLYLDDGLSFDDKARFDIFTSNNGDSTFDFNVKATDMKGKKRGQKQENIGIITFLWASKSGGLDKINKAVLVDSTGAKVNLKAPVYDATTDTLKVDVTIADGTKSWTFWDFTEINLSTTA